MPDFDLGATRSDEGFFLLRGAGQRPFEPPAVNGSGWRFCGTFRDSPPSLRDAVLDLIRNARRKVFVTSFILGDDDLIEALAETARRLTGGVYVISELSEDSLRRGLAQLAERGDVGQKVEAEKKRFVSLVHQGIAVRGHENCHAKFVVVDDEVAWVGSANLETRAFTLVGEAGVVLDDPHSLAVLARMFAHMWTVGCRYELPSFDSGYRVRDRGGERSPAAFTAPASSVVWTDGPPTSGLHRNLLDVIAGARRDLVLASFSLNRLDEHPNLLLDPLAAAVARGVRVRLFVRAMNDRDRHRRQAGLLHDLGVEIVADDLNHAKAAVADGERGLLFSANFDAEHGLRPGTGIEVGARLDGTPALPELSRYLEHTMDCATRRYVPTPTTRQLHDGLAARWQASWSHGETLEVSCPPDLWRALASAPGPALWFQKPGAPVEIAIGTLRLTMRPDGVSVRDGAAVLDLAQWIRSPTGNAKRGFCPARLRRCESGTRRLPGV